MQPFKELSALIGTAVDFIFLHKTQTMTSRFFRCFSRTERSKGFPTVTATEDKENDLVFSHVFTLSQIYTSLHKILIFSVHTSQAYRHTHTLTQTDAVLFPATKLCRL